MATDTPSLEGKILEPVEDLMDKFGLMQGEVSLLVLFGVKGEVARGHQTASTPFFADLKLLDPATKLVAFTLEAEGHSFPGRGVVCPTHVFLLTFSS